MTWTRTMSWSSVAPAAPNQPPPRGRAESHRPANPSHLSQCNTRKREARIDPRRPVPARPGRARPGRWFCRAGWHRLRRAGHHRGADVRQDQRAPSLAALEWAAAYPAGEYVGQESFMRAGEVRALARQARVGPGVPVLDLCCGVAGPGRMITAESGCRYLGVDHSPGALATARQLAGELPCRFEQAHLPPLPGGRFEVVLLLETMLAFPGKAALVGEVARALEPGWRV